MRRQWFIFGLVFSDDRRLFGEVYQLHIMFLLIDRTPNKTPEPTAVGRVSLFVKAPDCSKSSFRVTQLRMLGIAAERLIIP